MTHPIDFGKTNPLGIFEIGEDGTSTIELNPIIDFVVEDVEIFTIILISSSNEEDHWQDVSLNVNIHDAETPTPSPTQTETQTETQTDTPTPTDTPTETQTPYPQYELVASSYSINEGEEVTITLVTKNVPEGSIVRYAMTHPQDFTDMAPIGKFIVSETGETELKIKPIEDYQIEGTELLTITLIESDVYGEHWRNVSVSVTIIDSSTPPTYKLESSALEVNEEMLQLL